MTTRLLFLPTPRILAVFLFLLASLPALGAREYGYRVLERKPHNPEVFTQGFVLNGGRFFESSGHYGRSYLLRYPRDEREGKEERLDLPRNIFAEGITVVGDRLYLLSWKAGKAWALNKDSFDVLSEFRYNGEGWGLTHNGHTLIMSDGSDVLRFYEADFSLRKALAVRLNGEALSRLNELEYHDGLIWANVWYSDKIYGIDAETGSVSAVVDLAELRDQAGNRSSESVLNGIAYDPEREAFWVTGKYWRYRYLIQLKPE